MNKQFYAQVPELIDLKDIMVGTVHMKLLTSSSAQAVQSEKELVPLIETFEVTLIETFIVLGQTKDGQILYHPGSGMTYFMDQLGSLHDKSQHFSNYQPISIGNICSAADLIALEGGFEIPRDWLTQVNPQDEDQKSPFEQSLIAKYYCDYENSNSGEGIQSNSTKKAR